MRCVCVRCVCASLILCVTQLNMECEVIRIGRLHITRTIFALMRDAFLLCVRPLLTFSLGFLMGLLLCCHSNSSTAECRGRRR